ncbi:MAG TPA: hypothetical protein VGM82_03765 [Gemmatimonadaceae bacterium]
MIESPVISAELVKCSHWYVVAATQRDVKCRTVPRAVDHNTPAASEE